jgi:hypothetical protein
MTTSKETQTNQKTFNKVWNHYIQQGRPFKLNLWKLVEADIIFLNDKNTYVDTIPLVEENPVMNTNMNFGKGFDDRGNPTELTFTDIIKTAYAQTLTRVFANKNTNTIKNFEARQYQRAFRKKFKEVLESLANDYSLTTPSPIAKTVAAKKFASKYKK